MDAQLKQRIVGTVVLIVVICLFLPVFFHHSTTKQKMNQTEKLHTVNLDISPQLLGNKEGKVLPQQLASATVTPVKTASATVKVIKVVRAETPTKSLSSVSRVKRNKFSPKKLTAVSAKLKVHKKITVGVSHHRNRKIRHHSKLHAIKHDNKVLDSALVLGTKTHAWVVQLASFSSSENAIKLVTRLRKKGFDAYYRQRKYGNRKSICRVYVGPEVKLIKLKRLQVKLKKEFHLNGFILRYKS